MHRTRNQHQSGVLDWLFLANAASTKASDLRPRDHHEPTWQGSQKSSQGTNYPCIIFSFWDSYWDIDITNKVIDAQSRKEKFHYLPLRPPPLFLQLLHTFGIFLILPKRIATLSKFRVFCEEHTNSNLQNSKDRGCPIVLNCFSYYYVLQIRMRLDCSEK